MARDPLIGFLEKRSRRRFTALVKATRNDVLNAAFRVTGDQDLAEDVTQDVFVKLLTTRWNPEHIRCGKALLISTTVLTAMMRLRSEDRRVHREKQAAAPHTVQPSGLSRDQLLDIRDAVLELPLALQACVELRYYGGLSTREIAVALECSQSAVKVRLARARTSLRSRLGPSAALFLFPLLASESQAAIVAILPSATLFRELSRIARDGPAMSAVAAGAATGSSKALASIAAFLLLATTGGWFLTPRNLPGEGKPHDIDDRQTTLLHSTRTTEPPIVSEQTLAIELSGDGLDWPPESVHIRLSGEGLERSCTSENGASVSMTVPAGTYTLEADGRPQWTRESVMVVVDPDTTEPQPITVELTDSFDLEGLVRDPDGNGVASCVIKILGPDLEEICEVTTRDRRNPHRHPPLEPHEFRIHLPLGSIHELRAYHSSRLYAPSVMRIVNDAGTRRLRRDLVLQPAGPPLEMLLLDCNGAPINAPAHCVQVRVDKAKRWSAGHMVLTEDKRTDGTLLLRTFPRDAPFPLLIECKGYAPTQRLVDPSRLPELLEIQLDCAEIFHGRVEPATPRNVVWNVVVRGPTGMGGAQAVDEDGRFSVSAPELKNVTVEVIGFGYERLLVDLSAPTSLDEPAILRPQSYGDGEARVRIVVENRRADVSPARATLEPSKQDFSNLYQAYSLQLSAAEVVFEGVLPGHYDVKILGADGENLAVKERQFVRAPETAIEVVVERALCVVQILKRSALEDPDLFLRVDGAIEVEVPRDVDTALELPVRPGWHQLELSNRRGTLFYRGLLDLKTDPPAVFDLSKTLSMEVRRNGPSAPVFLRDMASNLSDGFKQARVCFPLDPAAAVTRIPWVLGPETNLVLEGEQGYFTVRSEEACELRLALGRQRDLEIPLNRTNDEGRCFLLGTIAGERAVYWALAPARSGDSVVVPIETNLSRWALLQYRGDRLEHGIVDGKPLEQVTYRIRVTAGDGSPAGGASVRIRGSSLLGLDLECYFHCEFTDSRFTLNEGLTGADGEISLEVTAVDAVEAVVSHNGLTRVQALPWSARAISIGLEK